jgi:hypothetical protein
MKEVEAGKESRTILSKALQKKWTDGENAPRKQSDVESLLRRMHAWYLKSFEDERKP